MTGLSNRDLITCRALGCNKRRVRAGASHCDEHSVEWYAIEADQGALLSRGADDAHESKRRRLERALESLRKQHQWGDLTDDAYRDERRAIEADLARLPATTTDTLVAFDQARVRLLSMPDAIAAASLERRAEIVRLLVARVECTKTEGISGLEWTPPAAPYFRGVLSERAVWDSNPRHED